MSAARTSGGPVIFIWLAGPGGSTARSGGSGAPGSQPGGRAGLAGSQPGGQAAGNSGGYVPPDANTVPFLDRALLERYFRDAAAGAGNG